MKKKLLAVLATGLFTFGLSTASIAASITVDFSYDTIAIGQFTFDDTLDDAVAIGYESFESFTLNIPLADNGNGTSYDLQWIKDNLASFTYFELSYNSQYERFNGVIGAVTGTGIPGFYMSNAAVWDYTTAINPYFGVPYADLTITENYSSVPEAATMLLFGTGLVGLIGIRRKKKE